MAHINIFQNETKLSFEAEYCPTKNYKYHKDGPYTLLKIGIGHEETIWVFLDDLCVEGLSKIRDEINRYLMQLEQMGQLKGGEIV